MLVKNNIECNECREKLSHRDEMVFLHTGLVVEVSEQYPDWDEVYCLDCAESKKLI